MCINREYITFFLLLSFVSLLTVGCVKKPVAPSSSSLFLQIDQDAIGKEIERLENIVTRSPQPDASISHYYLDLALLYCHYNNNAPQYPRSMEMLDTYLDVSDKNNITSDVYGLKLLLEKINEPSEDIQALKKNNRLLNTIGVGWVLLLFVLTSIFGLEMPQAAVKKYEYEQKDKAERGELPAPKTREGIAI